MNEAAPDGKELKYARRERERRLLLAERPDGRVVHTVRIEDRYFTGTRMRLRQARSMRGDDERSVYKLTQKVPGPGGEPGLITTMYLTAAEHAALAGLPAATLRKTRLSMPPLGIDVFEGALAGLVLAEAEFTDDEAMARFAPPPFAVADVTTDQRFTGGQLAVCTRPQIASALADYGISAPT
jgi:hypothetical protein